MNTSQKLGWGAVEVFEEEEGGAQNYSSGKPARWCLEAGRPARQESLNLDSNFGNKEEESGSRDTDERKGESRNRLPSPGYE